jgi:hypothetical protein
MLSQLPSLAKTVAQSRDRFAWFSDRPPSFTSELELSEADIAAARNARTALGNRIENIDAVSPGGPALDRPRECGLGVTYVDGWRSRSVPETNRRDESCRRTAASSRVE